MINVTSGKGPLNPRDDFHVRVGPSGSVCHATGLVWRKEGGNGSGN